MVAKGLNPWTTSNNATTLYANWMGHKLAYGSRCSLRSSGQYRNCRCCYFLHRTHSGTVVAVSLLWSQMIALLQHFYFSRIFMSEMRCLRPQAVNTIMEFHRRAKVLRTKCNNSIWIFECIFSVFALCDNRHAVMRCHNKCDAKYSPSVNQIMIHFFLVSIFMRTLPLKLLSSTFA